MAQISKWKLGEEIEFRILEIFWRSWEKGSKIGVASSIGEIFTETEKTVLAKRLAIAMMLFKGYGYREIREFLHVSPPTIAKVNDWLEYKSGLREVVSKLVEESKGEKIWQQLKEVIAEMEPELVPGTNWAESGRRRTQEKNSRLRRKAAIEKV